MKYKDKFLTIEADVPVFDTETHRPLFNYLIEKMPLAHSRSVVARVDGILQKRINSPGY